MTTSPAIIATLTAYNSRRDIYGNCYWAFSYCDNQSGREICGTVSGGRSNVSGILYYLNGGSFEPRNVSFSNQELPIREFNRMTKDWPYAGCLPEELAKFIRAGLVEKVGV